MIAVAAPIPGRSPLSAVETEFLAMRTRPPALRAAFAAALRHAAGDRPAPHFVALGERVADAMDAATRGRVELPYHNRHHVAEAVLAMGWLAGAARRAGAVAETDAVLGVVAMVGHDLLHDGSPPNGGVLEARAAAEVAAIAAEFELSTRERATLHAVIIGTDPFRVVRNAARAAGELAVGPLGGSVDAVIAMANEADVFASVMPTLGGMLTGELIRERLAAGEAGASSLASFTSRLGFLTTYGNLGPAARRLGMDRLRARQVDAFARFGSTPGAGATALDGMPREEAWRRYSAALTASLGGGDEAYPILRGGGAGVPAGFGVSERLGL
jgi:hypothetical protein